MLPLRDCNLEKGGGSPGFVKYMIPRLCLKVRQRLQLPKEVLIIAQIDDGIQ